MSLTPYARSKMDEAANTDRSAESITSTLKGMLKINGSNEEQDEQSSPTPAKDEVTEQKADEEDNESKKDESEVESAASSPPRNTGGPQKIDLSKIGDGECVRISSDDVTLVTSPAFEKDNENGSGSNKVRIKPITKFEWEHKYYNGSLVSVTDNFIAYAIKSRTNAVRVISRKNTSNRLLLKGFMAPVCDIAFAHSTSTLVAAVDESGTLFVWDLSQIEDTTDAKKKIHVKCDFNDSTYHRVVWLTFMHCDIDGVNTEQIMQLDEAGDLDASMCKRLLAVSHGKDVEIWDVRAAFTIAEDDEQETDKSKLSETFMTVSHDDIITDCVLSPEGSVIAVASNDGYVKFWQIATDTSEPPTCLHKWKPHDDKPVSLVTFCDDRTQAQLVLYWRFMLTGCCQNSELKIWCTVSWDCLQKISFLPTPGSTEISPSLKCVLHAAADYLVVADINRNVVYVLHCNTDIENEKASLTSISQYLLTTPILSFAFIGAQKCKFKPLVAMDGEGDEEDQDDDDDNDDDEESDEEKDGDDDDDDSNKGVAEANKKVHGVLINLVSITGKSLESLDIRFVPNTLPDESLSYSTYNTITDGINLASVDESLSSVAPSLDTVPREEDIQDILNPSPMQDEDDLEESQNKTELTDAEQSTLLANNDNAEGKEDDEGDCIVKPHYYQESEVQKTPDRAPNTQTSLLDSNINDLVHKLRPDEPPLAHSSPSVRINYDENDNRRGQGEGEASASPPGKPDGQPVLLTPDAFFSSLRKNDDVASIETTFTHVTPLEQVSILASERDKSLQDSALQKSPELSTNLPAPPGFPQMPNNSSVFTPDLRQASPPLIPAASIRSSLSNMVGQSSTSPYQSLVQPATVSGTAGPYGDNQAFGFIAKDKSPDLISSASSVENVGNNPSEGRILIGGPLPGAVGGSGDALYLTGPSKESQDVDETASNSSRKSDTLPTTSSAPWPKAPDVTMSRPLLKKVACPSSRDEFLRASGLSQKSASSVRPDSALHSDLASGDKTTTPGLSAAMGAELMETIVKLQSQQDEMMKILQKENRRTNQNAKNVEATLKRFEQQQNERLDRALRSLSDSQKKFQADMKSQSTSTSEHSTSKLERSMRSEMKNTVLPGLAKSLDPLKDQLHTTLAQKITATDYLLKENIAKLVKSRETVDVIGTAAGRAIQGQVHNAFKDSFLQIVVPAVEKSCNMMFQQISSTFQRGMDEGVEKLEKQLKSRVRSEVDRISSAEKQSKEAVTELRDTATQLTSKLSGVIEKDVQKYVRSELKRVQEQMAQEMTKLFKAQHEAALKEQKQVLTQCIHSTMAEIQPQQEEDKFKPLSTGSTSSTPNRQTGAYKLTFEQQQQAIISQLQQGNLNAAFQRALSAADLALVVFVCEMVDPTVLFGCSPCALNQPIILSLIQQLSCDLSRNMELKLKYLSEAVMNVDRTHQVTQEHLPTVMDALVKNLDSYITVLNSQPIDSANTPIIKQMKMLSMAAKSLK